MDTQSSPNPTPHIPLEQRKALRLQIATQLICSDHSLRGSLDIALNLADRLITLNEQHPHYI